MRFYFFLVVKFTATLQNITMFEGKSVTLKCRLNTKKIPFNVTWTKNGVPIGSRYKTKHFLWGSRLKVRRSRARDAGKFECIVSAAIKTVRAVGWLKILGRSLPTGTFICDWIFSLAVFVFIVISDSMVNERQGAGQANCPISLQEHYKTRIESWQIIK
jgi:hypothetical protein